MNSVKDLKVTFDFDEEADVLHISLGTGEPSYCEEVDDVLLVERGYFSDQITGFQIMDIRYHRIKQVNLLALVKKALENENKELTKYFRQKRQDVPDMISKRLSRNAQVRRLLQEQNT